MRADRTRLLAWGLVAAAVVLMGRAAWVQLWQHDHWRTLAENQQRGKASLPAPRGTIRDDDGQVLAESRGLVMLAIDLKEVRDRRRVARALARAGVPDAQVRRVSNPALRWIELPQRFLPDDVAELQGMRGVRVTPVAERVAPVSDAVRRLVGRATPTRGLDGLEFALDSLLAGRQGTARVLRDPRGGVLPSPHVDGDTAMPGHAVRLTIRQSVQDLVERELRSAMAATGAEGGDIVVLDPQDGAVLALASRRPDPRSTAATTLTEPFEPGSTLKPFIAGRLLDLQRARPDEWINTYNGTLKLGARTITDVHRAPRMTLTEVIAQSSNIGIVQFAARFSSREQYELLRDLGFGTPTGLPYPLEAAGTLREPRRWSATTPASLAMGYEVAVTPLQLAVAYASIANGGELLQPGLLREVRTPDGRVVYRHTRRVLRRVFSPDAAATLRRMLVAVVESGTSGGAGLPTIPVGGKSGTARRVGKGGRYEAGAYTASFVGLFPAEAPQLVVVVKLDNPRGDSYYGGRVAAPVAGAVFKSVMAGRNTLREPTAVAAAPRRVVPDSAGAVRESLLAEAVPPDTGDVPVVVELGQPRAARPSPPPRAVPDVRGLPARRAVLSLHQAGFKVQWRAAPGTDPAAGTMLKAGSVVQFGAGALP
ncbi:MAG: penicillin-binding transpeptidase domain-containing protein [Gemmatimonadaceae bacterium]|nr:penicillin-binding transpeptidase domain-containing protein [Gemmatimonadaceae bacterium]